MRSGADANQPDDLQETPLHLAVAPGKRRVDRLWRTLSWYWGDRFPVGSCRPDVVPFHLALASRLLRRREDAAGARCGCSTEGLPGKVSCAPRGQEQGRFAARYRARWQRRRSKHLPDNGSTGRSGRVQAGVRRVSLALRDRRRHEGQHARGRHLSVSSSATPTPP